MPDITLILVTLLSLTLAAVMTTLAWRLAREERRRSDARVAALAAEIHSEPRLSEATALDRLHATGPSMTDLPLHHEVAAPIATSADVFAARASGLAAPNI